MSGGSEVTRPGGEATVGVDVPPGGGGPRRRRKGREEPEFRSYYELPILNQITWTPRDIAGYLFTGGLAGASGVLAGAAAVTGRPGLARVARLSAAASAHVSLVLLIDDLGRPSRFLHMLRVFKPTSPMNVGSWLLGGFATAATVAAAAEALRLPVVGGVAQAVTTTLGPGVATYTGALISNTAVPAWHDAGDFVPAVFAASALSSATGVAMAFAPAEELRPVRWLAPAAGLTETVLMKVMRRRLGHVAHAYEEKPAHRLLQLADAFTIAGAAGLVADGVRGTGRRWPRLLAGLSLTAGSALMRFGLFHAGVASAADPSYTVVPQRERLAQRAAHVGAGGPDSRGRP